MNKRILLKKEATDAIRKGVNIACDTVKVTLGYDGKNVMISENYVADYGFHSKPLICSKDGANVLSNIQLSDPIENMGVLLVQQAAYKTAQEAGDGTTTTCLFTQAIVNEGLDLIEKGENAVQIKKGIDKAVGYVVEELKKIAIPVGDDLEKIRSIASVSANNDSFIGDLIAKAYAKIGPDGIIKMEDAKGVDTEIKITDGFQFNRGYISPYFITNKSKEECELDNPYILLYDRTLSQWKEIEPILIKTTEEKRPLLIICSDCDGEALANLAMNTAAKRISTCVVRSPLFGDFQRELMEDLATCVGGVYVNDLKGMKLENTSLDMLGISKKVIITNGETTIIGGVKNKEAQEELLNDLKMNLTQANGDAEKEKIQKRIARLTGAVAVLSVGGKTEVELKERKDRCEDAIRATKSSIEEGYIVGSGTAFIKIKQAIVNEKMKNVNAERPGTISFDKGMEIILTVLERPLEQICLNSGIDPSEIIPQVKAKGGAFGYNAKTEKVEDLLEAGILDPIKVLRCSLENAASASGMLLTSDALICDVFN